MDSMSLLDGVDVTFTNIRYTVSVPKQKELKQVLHGVSGKFKSGEMTAIMGPSGCGKTSLLNILTGFTGGKEVSGVVSFGSGTPKEGRKQCSYILQDDNLYGYFTVNETMMLATSLKKTSSYLGKKDKLELIDTTLDMLQLGHTKNTKCAKLSGGQQKRLSIALELLDNPPVLILDEPTTGLDSSSSSQCIKLLHKLSREGRTIICTIHQPSTSIYELFDHVYALSGGVCTYQGAATNTVSYLAASVGMQCPQYHCPADFLLEVLNGDYGDYVNVLRKAAIEDRWRSPAVVLNEQALPVQINSDKLQIVGIDKSSSRVYGKTVSPATCFKLGFLTMPHEWRQLWVLIGRCHIQLYRDWTVTHLKLVAHVLVAVLFGLLFGDSGINASKTISNLGLQLISVLYIWYTTAMPGVLRYPSEIPIIKKESFNNWYHVRTYYLATLITSTPVHILFSAIFSTIVFTMTNQPLEFDRFFKVMLVFVLTTIAADGFGLLFGAILDPVNGTFIGAILTCYMILFSGILSMFSHMPDYLHYIAMPSILKYSVEAIVLALYDYNRTDLYCPDKELYCHYKSTPVILDQLGMKPHRYDLALVIIIGQLIFYKTIAYVLLKRRMRMG